MPILYIQNQAGNGDLSAFTIPAPPTTNKTKTVIDYAAAFMSGASANSVWTLCVTATGGGHLPVASNSRVVLGTLNNPVAVSGGSFRNEFPGGLTVCTIASSVVIQALSVGTSGSAVNAYIGYHYE